MNIHLPAHNALLFDIRPTKRWETQAYNRDARVRRIIHYIADKIPRRDRRDLKVVVVRRVFPKRLSACNPKVYRRRAEGVDVDEARISFI
jgi:hypothetical protein